MALDARRVTVKLAELTEHLECAICHGILRDAHTIPDCLHSFCKSCIYRHFLVKGSCICPKCNKTLNSRPIATLIADQKIQEVVDRIFPEFKEQEVIQEKEFYAKNKFKLKDQNGANRASPSSSRGRPKNSSSTRQGTKPNNNGGSNRQLTIEVYPQQTNANVLPTLKFPFMQVSGNLKMSELRKLIRKRLKLSDDLQLEMACMGTTVGPELSANFILRTIWQHQNQKEPLVLHYRHITA
ncbi:hypothetical protein DVH05_019034 [Phytophthora capsici]|nr:hypothetical protein DVH05_019034 [Phytophthora capsici]